ncbi:MAG: rod shape-determining protein [Candidatus Melainabacteria bacterium]|jgi:rod shape-determining protein MreB and related proteins|nr:rod shape-determining protein [Candidatus Melainabacteria bacterium]
MSFFKKFSKNIGIDLGTANTLVYTAEGGIILREPSVVAVNRDTGDVLAVGEEARAMIGRTPSHIIATRPLRDGVIADFRHAEMMLRYFMEKATGKGAFKPLSKPRIAIGIPSGITEVERRAVREAAENAGAGQVFLIEEPMAAAIGAGLAVADPIGSMIVDIGGGTTEVAVTSLSGIVISESVRVAGDELNESIVTYMKKVYNLAIGETTAEMVKIKLGSAFKISDVFDEDQLEVRGLNLLNGLPRTVLISRPEVREAMSEPLQAIVDSVKRTLERIPPELAADVYDRGIVLAGGGALLPGLDEMIAHETEVPVHIAEDPLSCVVLGAGRVLHDKALRRVLDLAGDPSFA